MGPRPFYTVYLNVITEHIKNCRVIRVFYIQRPLAEDKLWAFSHSSAVSRHRPPRTCTSKSESSQRIRSPAQSVYNPPSPVDSCNGTAARIKTKADPPRKQLFVATAAEERPGFASTMYASVLA